MREFFKGWRRKAGCVALVIALGFMAGWIRCQGVNEQLTVPWGNLRLLHVGGINGYFSCGTTTDRPPLDPVTRVRRYSYHHSPASQSPFELLKAYEWFIQFGQFRIGACDYGSTTNRLAVIPYWSLAIPLALLAAYLLLWKPLKTK